ncbi:hypothetical protein RVF83_16835 [Gordonia rubripertincta]|uniref:hypothetical protein n=1 Tax=Gordonia rubripertincta TaxID=36822 RepID=UPI001FFA1916|nr:hypothetical protein [Gordonia rubripertincta]
MRSGARSSGGAPVKAVVGSAEVTLSRPRPPAPSAGSPAATTEVVVIGRPGALTARLCRTLRDRGLNIEIVDPGFGGPMVRDDTRTPVPEQRRSAGARSCIAVLGRAPRPRRRWWDWRGRRLERRQEDELIDAVSIAASNARRLGLLVVAEASTRGETEIARERARHVARVAGYEAAVNGNALTSTFYLVTSASDGFSRSSPAIVGWVRRRLDL